MLGICSHGTVSFWKLIPYFQFGTKVA